MNILLTSFFFSIHDRTPYARLEYRIIIIIIRTESVYLVSTRFCIYVSMIMNTILCSIYYKTILFLIIKSQYNDNNIIYTFKWPGKTISFRVHKIIHNNGITSTRYSDRVVPEPITFGTRTKFKNNIPYNILCIHT